MPLPRAPSTTDLKNGYLRFENALFGCFSIYVWQIKYVSEKPRDAYDHICENAIVQSNLACLRSLDDFFNTDAPHNDDIIARDFGYTKLGRLIGSDERTRINKKIIHMSFEPLWDRQGFLGPNGDGTFAINRLLPSAVDRSLDFVRFVEGGVWFSGTAEKARIRRTLKNVPIMLKNLSDFAALPADDQARVRKRRQELTDQALE